MRTRRYSRVSHLIISAVLVLSTFLFSGCATRSSYSPAAAPIFDKLIVPGKRIGPIALGMPQADVVKILGIPKQTWVDKDGSIYNYPDLDVRINDKTNSVSSLMTLSSEYATADGIRVGMTEPEVRAKRGKPSRMHKDEHILVYWYGANLRITFPSSKGYRIEHIIIYE